MKKLLITTATHGDEEFSIPIVKELARRYQFDWWINNPQALKAKKRFIDTDLNRSGPGDIDSAKLEERLASQIINAASEYNQVIDIHGTTSNSGIFIIISDPNWQNIEFAKSIPINKVVLWPSLEAKGPLTQFIPNSLEIECGPKESPKTARQLKRVLDNYLSGKKSTESQEWYIVTGCLKGMIKKPMEDFKQTKYKEKMFYPLLVDQYSGIKCYTLEKLANTLEF